MPRIDRKAQVPYTAEQMFDLVNDVESYPEFVHWVRDARVDRRMSDGVECTLDIGVSGIHKSFRTRNRLERPKRIDIELVSGPFRRLEGAWSFTDTAGGGSEVALSLDFAVRPSPFSVVFSTVFEELARSQMNAFVSRADEVYG